MSLLPEGPEYLVKLLCGKASHMSLMMSGGTLTLCHVKVFPEGMETRGKLQVNAMPEKYWLT